jgi:hypothetical protein
MFSSSVLARGKAALQGDETEQRLASLLHDDSVQIISSFELNQVASLTYGAMVCDKIFEILQSILAHPVSYSVLTLQKALVLTKHILIYGAESVVNSAIGLGRHVEALATNYNTVLMAQQQQGAAGIMYRLQGGGVDKGGPVRTAAAAVHALLSNRDKLRHERAVNADPNSLVPVGDVNQIAFCSDQVRHTALEKRIQQQQKAMEIKSNLAKADNGFGSGYNAANGKHVVGAAHSIEDMMREAERAKKREESKFSDDGTGRGYTAPTPELSFALAQAPPQQQYSHQQQQQSQNQNQQLTNDSAGDLLGMDNPSSYNTPVPVPEVDLLDFSSGPSDNVSGSGSGNSYAGDPWGGTTTGDYFSSGGTGGGGEATLSGTADVDLFGSATMTTAVAAAPTPDTTADLFGSMTMTANSEPSNTTITKKSIMGGGTVSAMNMGTTSSTMSMTPNANAHDRFAALDALQGGGGAGGGTASDSRSLSLHSMHTNTPAHHQPNSLSDLGGWGMTTTTTTTAPTSTTNATATAMPAYSSDSSWKVSASMVPPAAATNNANNNDDDDDDDNGFAMGGSAGAGLEPLAAAPAAPPPPPPPPPGETAGFW